MRHRNLNPPRQGSELMTTGAAPGDEDCREDEDEDDGGGGE